MNILSEGWKQKIKEEFYNAWKTCGNCAEKGEKSIASSSRQPLLFVIHEVIKNVNISDEINYRPHKDIRKVIQELDLACPTCHSKLSAYSEVGKYIGDDEFWHSFGYLLKQEKLHLENYLTHKSSNTSRSASIPTIACIDDSHQVVKVMKLILEKAEYKFIGIQEPLQAVPKLITTQPNLIFLDIAMPIVNGYEICAQLRRVSKLKEVPIVMLTSKDGVIDRVRAKVVGASGFVTKPIDTSKILNVVKKFLAVADNKENINESNELLTSDLFDFSIH